MKFFNLFVDVFCIFGFLTLGSLMMMVALHILPMEDALIQLQAIYESGFQSLQLGVTSFLFILVGLALSKKLVKKSRRDDDFFIVESDTGRLTVTYAAVNELVRRTLRKFDGVRRPRVSTNHEHSELKVAIDIQVTQGCLLPDLTEVIKRDVEERLTKMLQSKILITVAVHISKIIEEAPLALHASH